MKPRHAAVVGLVGLSALVVATAVRARSPFMPIDLSHYLFAGRMLISAQDPYRVAEFFLPPWSVVLFGPLALLPSQAAAVLWLVTAAAAQAYSAVQAFRWVNRPARSAALALPIALAILMPAALFAYVTGQISPLVAVGILEAFWFARRPHAHPLSVALALVLATLKPHIVAVPIVVVLLELAARRRYSHLVWVGVLALVLTLFGMLVLPGWIPSMMDALQRGAFLGGPDLAAPGFRGLRELGVPGWIIVPVLAYILYAWSRERLTARVAALALAGGLLVVPYTRVYDQVLLVFPACLVILVVDGRRLLRTAIAVLAVLVVPWTPAWPLAPALMFASLVLLPQQAVPERTSEIPRGKPGKEELSSQARNL